jgi:hypothetical protein
MGRKSEVEYERKKKSKQIVKKISKPSAASPAGIVMGLGVLYQIIMPKLGLLSRFFLMIRRTLTVIRIDIKMATKRIRGINPDWEKYKQFDELARRGKKP